MGLENLIIFEAIKYMPEMGKTDLNQLEDFARECLSDFSVDPDQASLDYSVLSRARDMTILFGYMTGNIGIKDKDKTVYYISMENGSLKPIDERADDLFLLTPSNTVYNPDLNRLFHRFKRKRIRWGQIINRLGQYKSVKSHFGKEITYDDVVPNRLRNNPYDTDARIQRDLNLLKDYMLGNIPIKIDDQGTEVRIGYYINGVKKPVEERSADLILLCPGMISIGGMKKKNYTLNVHDPDLRKLYERLYAKGWWDRGFDTIGNNPDVAESYGRNISYKMSIRKGFLKESLVVLVR